MVIYVFSDEDGVPKYVGKAKDLNRRIKDHLRERHKRKTKFYSWLNKQIKEDKAYYVDILEEVTNENWQEKEKYWIKHVKDCNYPLKNMTDGGDGNNNQIFSQETLEKRRVKATGRKHTQETKDLLRNLHKGKKKSDEHVKNMSLARGKKVYATDLNTNKVTIYDSCHDVFRKTGIAYQYISIWAKNEKIMRGFKWSYN